MLRRIGNAKINGMPESVRNDPPAVLESFAGKANVVLANEHTLFVCRYCYCVLEDLATPLTLCSFYQHVKNARLNSWWMNKLVNKI